MFRTTPLVTPSKRRVTERCCTAEFDPSSPIYGDASAHRWGGGRR